jgi:HK97 gp10 family phage protein
LSLVVDVHGTESAVARLERISEKLALEVDAKAREAVELCTRTAQLLAPVRTGRLRANIDWAKSAPLRYVIFSRVEYSVFVEYGTSRMAAQPFMRPTLLFGRDLVRRLVAEAIAEACRR